ncbi:aspartate/glutamate racemase family protein [Pelagibacterales bacterium SAG-MED31]|nr:aspartate/glutamate racemase family protein [Pelagibacterales bacterium SAG-MED31]
MYQLGQSIKSKPRNPEINKGRHPRAKLGFILMSTDLAAESDFFDIAPYDVAVHVTRLKTDDYTTNETLSRHIEFMADAASRIQPDTKPNVISYSCTSGSIVIGEEKIKEEIKKGAPYAIPMTLVTGVIDALKELKIKNLVVGTPYLDEINTKEAEFLYKKGFSIINIQGLNLSKGIEFGRVTPEYWIKFAEEINEKDADAIFLSCGGIRSTEVIDKIEQKIGKPVITSNQAQMWSCLRRAGVNDNISGFGELFNLSLTK